MDASGIGGGSFGVNTTLLASFWQTIAALQNLDLGAGLDGGDDPRNPSNKKKITLKKARDNYLRAKAERLYQDIQSMEVQLHESDFDINGRVTINFDGFGYNGKDNALIHGNVTFERVPGNPEYAQVVYVDRYGCRCGAYDFEMHGNPISTRGFWTMFRNALTAFGGIVNSSYQNGLIISGKPFLIQYTNVVKILK